MKRRILAAVFAVLLAVLLICPAFALDVPDEQIEMTDDGVFVVKFDAAKAGEKYSLWIISGVYDSVDGLDRDNTDAVLYYAEATAEGSALAFQNVRPRSEGEFTAFVAGAEQTYLIGSYRLKQDTPATPDEPTVPDEPVTPDEPTVPDTPGEPDIPSRLSTQEIVLGAVLGAAALIIVVVIIVLIKKRVR